MDENSSVLHEPKTGDSQRLITGNLPVSFSFKAYGGFFQWFYLDCSRQFSVWPLFVIQYPSTLGGGDGPDRACQDRIGPAHTKTPRRARRFTFARIDQPL
jgi:hypothetical protein